MQWPITCRVGRLVKSVLLVAVVLLGIWATSTGLCLTGLVLAARAFGPTVGQLTKPIHFQYSASTATAFAALHSEELAKGVERSRRQFQPGQQMNIWLELDAAEANSVVNADVFKVLAHVISTDGQSAATVSRPCWIPRRWLVSRWVRRALHEPFGPFGWWAGGEIVKIPLLKHYTEQPGKPFLEFKAELQAVGQDGILPHLYNAKLHVDLKLGCIPRLLHMVKPAWIAVPLLGLGLSMCGTGSLAALIGALMLVQLRQSTSQQPGSPALAAGCRSAESQTEIQAQPLGGSGQAQIGTAGDKEPSTPKQEQGQLVVLCNNQSTFLGSTASTANSHNPFHGTIARVAMPTSQSIQKKAPIGPGSLSNAAIGLGNTNFVSTSRQLPSAEVSKATYIAARKERRSREAGGSQGQKLKRADNSKAWDSVKLQENPFFQNLVAGMHCRGAADAWATATCDNNAPHTTLRLQTSRQQRSMEYTQAHLDSDRASASNFLPANEEIEAPARRPGKVAAQEVARDESVSTAHPTRAINPKFVLREGLPPPFTLRPLSHNPPDHLREARSSSSGSTCNSSSNLAFGDARSRPAQPATPPLCTQQGSDRTSQLNNGSSGSDDAQTETKCT